MLTGLWWDEEDADHIRQRSRRYPGATDIDPTWTLEAATDPRQIVLDPDPRGADLRAYLEGGTTP